MGMDVFGQNPTTKVGEYFRNNVWWWHPLWDYCHQVAPDIIDEDTYGGGHSNSGDGLDAEDSIALADRLQEEIDAGRTKEYADEYEARRAAIPKDKCECCHGTGDRRNWVYYLLPSGAKFYPWQGEGEKQHYTAPPDDAERCFVDDWAKQCNGCNGCSGEGERESFEAAYPFSVENVVEFIEFLKYCGGFEIC